MCTVAERPKRGSIKRKTAETRMTAKFLLGHPLQVSSSRLGMLTAGPGWAQSYLWCHKSRSYPSVLKSEIQSILPIKVITVRLKHSTVGKEKQNFDRRGIEMTDTKKGLELRTISAIKKKRKKEKLFALHSVFHNRASGEWAVSNKHPVFCPEQKRDISV